MRSFKNNGHSDNAIDLAGLNCLEGVKVDNCRPRESVSSSPSSDLFFLEKYVLPWMGEDAFDGLCIHPPREQSNVCFDAPMKRELMALVTEQVKALDFKKNPVGLAVSNQLPAVFNDYDILACASCLSGSFGDGVGLTMCQQCVLSSP